MASMTKDDFIVRLLENQILLERTLHENTTDEDGEEIDLYIDTTHMENVVDLALDYLGVPAESEEDLSIYWSGDDDRPERDRDWDEEREPEGYSRDYLSEYWTALVMLPYMPDSDFENPTLQEFIRIAKEEAEGAKTTVVAI